MTLSRQRELTEGLQTALGQPFTFGGLRIAISYCARAKHPKNWIVGTHYHPWFEFNYVARGSVYTTVNGTEFLISAGQSFLIPPHVPHSHRHNGTGDDGICIRFSLEAADEAQPNRLLAGLSAAYSAAFSSGLEKMRFTGGLLHVQAAFALWLTGIYDLRSREELPVHAAQNMLSAQVILYLRESYASRIRTEDIANALNISYRSLSRKFKAETGMTIGEKLTEIRMDKAKQLLLSTKKTLSDIAQETGYDNEFYFSRIFKRQERMPPSRYRSRFGSRL